MASLLHKLRKVFDALTNEKEWDKRIEGLQQEKRRLDERAKKLERATLDGEEQWFISTVRKNPACALRVLEDCTKNVK
jgi:hypothetical protein